MEQNRKSTNKTKADPVILHRLGILRLRFRSDSIPDAAAYRQLIILTFQGVATTVSDFLCDSSQQ
jgi:hypothetical protein